MALPKGWVIAVAVLSAVLVGIAGMTLLQPPGDLLKSAAFSEPRITPNADGQQDIAQFSYSLSRPASVTLTFVNAAGQEYVFRDQEPREGDDYNVLFSGIVNGFRLEGEAGFRLPGEPPSGMPLLEARLIPNGTYTWTFTAETDAGESMSRTGTLEIAEADTTLPFIQSFEIAPTIFTPNQDGITDRVSINIFLAKPATLQVYLAEKDDADIQNDVALVYLAEREGARDEGEPGNHEFDYDGGVDQGFRPPADGDYTVHAVAQDDEGQRMRVVRDLSIDDSGLPQVEIVPQATGTTVCFSVDAYQEAYFSDDTTPGEQIAEPTVVCSDRTTIVMPVGDLLVFHLTVRNYGDTPIRTAGPFPGTVYNFNQVAASLNGYEESGAWRIGINCDTAMSNYPWRWALGSLDQLTSVYDEENEVTYYYLEPGDQAEVWGAVRMTDLIAARNPQNCWAGLIHESVRLSQDRVGARQVELVQP